MVSVDKEKCIGCGACASTCPEVFEMGEDQKAHVKEGQEDSDKDCVKEAAKNCPTSAISE